MPTSQIVDICRHTLLEVLLLASPILAIAVVVSLTVNIVQVLTSLQEATISAVPLIVPTRMVILPVICLLSELCLRCCPHRASQWDGSVGEHRGVER